MFIFKDKKKVLLAAKLKARLKFVLLLLIELYMIKTVEKIFKIKKFTPSKRTIKQFGGLLVCITK